MVLRGIRIAESRVRLPVGPQTSLLKPMEKPIFGKTEEIKDPVLMYLSEKSEALVNAYKAPDSNYTESCALIAENIAKMLLQSGKRPEIIFISGKRKDSSDIITNEPLKPLSYEGRVTWGAHIVCLCDGLVYDPMIGHTVPLEEYAHKAFGADVEIRTVVTKDRIEEFINR